MKKFYEYLVESAFSRKYLRWIPYIKRKQDAFYELSEMLKLHFIEMEKNFLMNIFKTECGK